MSVTEKYNERRKYKRDMSKIYYAMRKREGICARCGHEIDDESTSVLRCSKCLKIIADYRKDPVNKAHKKERDKRKYDICKAFGICVKCQTRDATKGKSTCHICTEKQRKNDAKRNAKNGSLPRFMLGDGKYCSTCAKTVEIVGNKLCNRCYAQSIKNLNKIRPKPNNRIQKINEGSWVATPCTK